MKLLLILGSPRSGTSWLARIFDSHPDVVYRHEPDEGLPDDRVPAFCSPADFERYGPAADRYLHELANMRNLRSVGSLPIFRKSYHSYVQHLTRVLEVMALRAAEKLSVAGAKAVRDIQIPDFADLESTRLVVLKSVNLVDRAALFTHMVPDLRTILILRHPCSCIASQLRGLRMQKFSDSRLGSELVNREQAKRRGLTLEQFTKMSRPEQLAWHWLIYNEKAMEGVTDCPQFKFVLHREIVRSADAMSRQLFAFADLPWSAQTEQFIHDSQNSSRGYRYYGVYRSSEFRADSWDDVLTAPEVKRILSIVGDSVPGRLFLETQDVASEMTAGSAS